MCWLKRDRWKAGIAIAGMLFLLVLILCIPISSAGAQERASGRVTSGTVQPTPTVDPTMVALQKEQLTLQNDKLKSDNSWAWLSSVSTIFGPLATIVTIIVGIFVAWNTFQQWFDNREDEQMRREDDQLIEREKRAEDQRIEWEKRNEERFQKVVEGLGSERMETRVGAAIMLRTFLQPGYERFYRQAFDLVVAYLRLRKADASALKPLSSPTHVPIVSKEPLLPEQQPPPPTASIPLDSLSQALITVFKESFPLARKELEKTNAQFDPQQLDATSARLDHAYLVGADLAQAWLERASLREANLIRARLDGALLIRAQLEGALLIRAQLDGANLSGAQLDGALLSGAQLDGANPGDANSLKDTKMNGVVGLTPEQREMCIKKGAIFDDVQQALVPNTISSSSLPVAPSDDTQVLLAPSVRKNPSTSSTDGSSATSSESDSQS